VYSREVDGKVLEFGTSGLLYRSNKLMYDRSTNTLWQQFLGEPVVGPLADSGIVLEYLPVLVTTWREWLASHPDTTVLDDNTGIYPPERYRPEEDPRSFYFGYRQSPDTMFPVPQRSDLLPTKALVLGLIAGGQPRAYSLELLQQEPVINDTLGGKDLVVVTTEKAGAARAYERGSYRFSLAQPIGNEEEVITLVDRQGQRWQVQEDALVLVGASEQRLLRLPSHMAYWFGWYAFYPATDVYGLP